MHTTHSLQVLASSALLTAAVYAQPSSSSAGLVKCLHDANVPFTIHGDALYANESIPFNVHLPYSPAAVVIPTTPDHVSCAVKCADTNGIKVQAKGGGHSYASFSLGGQDGSLIISMEKFSNVDVDQSTGVASVGTGQRLGNMALSLYNQSQRALPHGSCPGVGIGGHASHGGYGYSSRIWGLTLDTIVGLDVVVANGSAIHCSETEYPELFYAFRGAADSFGIITHFYFQTQPAPTTLAHFSYAFGADSLSGDGSQAADIMSHIQDWAQNATVMSDKIGFGVHIDTPTGLTLNGLYYGTTDDFANNIRPELLRTLPPANETLEAVDWPTWLAIFAEGSGPLITPLGSAYDEHSDFFAKSLLSPEANPVTHDAWQKYFEYMVQNGNLGTDATWYSIIDFYGGPGSYINSIPPTATSFSHRDRLFQFQNYGYTPNNTSPFPSNIQPFIRSLNAVIPDAMPDADFAEYVNYIDPSLTPEMAHDVYYGNETYTRLLGIKGESDPNLTFWNPLAIGV